MLGRVDCEPCGGHGEVEALTLEGDRVDVDCKLCGGFGGFPIYGPPTRERLAELEAQAAAEEADLAKWDTFVCTHCRFYCDAHLERGPLPCHACPNGLVVPLRDLQAATRIELPWRRRGSEVITLDPPDPRQGSLFGGAS